MRSRPSQSRGPEERATGTALLVHAAWQLWAAEGGDGASKTVVRGGESEAGVATDFSATVIGGGGAGGGPTAGGLDCTL